MPCTSEIGVENSGATQRCTMGSAARGALEAVACAARARSTSSSGDAASVSEKMRASPGKMPIFR